MRRANNLLPHIEEMDNLRLAFWKASKGKRYAGSVLAYQKDLERNLEVLQQQIKDGYVEVGDYRYFNVYEPKKREICASAFSEQVLHHALMNVCHDYFDRAQIFDSYASRKGKGTYAAIDRAEKYTNKYAWFLKLDVRKFFASIHHDVMKQQLARMFKEKKLLHIFYQIIDSYEASENRGLPIGNLTSQYFANHYLSQLDHHIKERLKAKAYVRYMDDMVLWSQDKQTLKDCLSDIMDFVEEKCKVTLKPFQLNRTNSGLPFLGYRLHPYHIRLLQKSKHRFEKKMRKIYLNKKEGIWDEASCQRRALSLIAFTQHAVTMDFRKRVLRDLEGQVS